MAHAVPDPLSSPPTGPSQVDLACCSPPFDPAVCREPSPTSSTDVVYSPRPSTSGSTESALPTPVDQPIVQVASSNVHSPTPCLGEGADTTDAQGEAPSRTMPLFVRDYKSQSFDGPAATEAGSARKAVEKGTVPGETSPPPSTGFRPVARRSWEDIVHPMSLVCSGSHSAALLDLVEGEVSQVMISHIARRVTALVDVAVPDPAVLTPPDSPTEPNSACKAPPSPLPSVEEFIWRLVEESGAYTPTLLVSLVYLDRIDKRYRAMRGTASSPLRLALASLICAGKYVNDRCPRSKHWASHSALFSTLEATKMEKEMLCLLNYNCSVSQQDVDLHFAPFLRSSPSLPPVPVPAFLPGSGPSEETIESTADILRLADLRARYAVLKSQRITCESDRQATTPPAVVIVSSPEVAPPSSTTPLGSPPST